MLWERICQEFSIVSKQLKKYVRPGKTSKWGSLPPSDVCVRNFLCPFFTVMKLLKHKALSDWSWVSCPKAKFSPSEIMNLTPFTVSDHLEGFIGELQDKVRTFRALASLPSQYTRFLLHFTNSMVCLCVTEWKPEMHPVQSECWAQLCGSVVPCNDWGQPCKGSLLGDYIDGRLW